TGSSLFRLEQSQFTTVLRRVCFGNIYLSIIKKFRTKDSATFTKDHTYTPPLLVWGTIIMGVVRPVVFGVRTRLISFVISLLRRRRLIIINRYYRYLLSLIAPFPPLGGGREDDMNSDQPVTKFLHVRAENHGQLRGLWIRVER